ncbi:MAG: hypothetical protein Q9228_005608 [Teloschistes exilis]
MVSAGDLPVAQLQFLTVRSHDALPCVAPRSSNTKLDFGRCLMPVATDLTLSPTIPDDTFTSTRPDLRYNFIMPAYKRLFGLEETFLIQLLEEPARVFLNNLERPIFPNARLIRVGSSASLAKISGTTC